MTFLYWVIMVGIMAVGLGGMWLGWVLHRELTWRVSERPRESLQMMSTQLHQVAAARPRAAATTRPVYEITDARAGRG